MRTWPGLTASCLVAAAGSASADTDIHGSVSSLATSNVFLDRQAESDLALRPALELTTFFAGDWAAGYSGQLNAYLRHEDLLSHRHELYLFANPVWGADDASEAVVQLGVETLRNDGSYAALNLVRPALLGRLALEPRAWLRWESSVETAYRWFYDDTPSDSLDLLADTRLVFMLPTHTTIAPRLGYGVRRYSRNLGAGTRDVDQQLEGGARVGQGLWRNAGLQLDYGFRATAGDSGLLQRKSTEAQFQYLGEEFLFSGHRGQVGFKQLAGRFTLGASLLLEQRIYGGWPAVDAAGLLTGEDRRDVRLTPRAYARWAWRSGDGHGFADEAGVSLDFTHTRQWSNSDWYDTTIDAAVLDVWMTW